VKTVYKELVIMIGIQGSGKSTYIDKCMVGKYQVMCIDDVRRAFGDIYNHRTEPIVRGVADMMARAFLERGLPIVVDATNVSVGMLKKWEDLAEQYEYKLSAIYMDIPIETCKKKIGINKLTEEVYDRTIAQLEVAKLYLFGDFNSKYMVKVVSNWF
jgi:predicted kinase